MASKKDDGNVTGSVGPITMSKEHFAGEASYTLRMQVPAKYTEARVREDIQQLLSKKYPGAQFIP